MPIKSNLAYYYAETQKPELRTKAMKYADEARKYYETTLKSDYEGLVANDIYVRIQCARADDVKTLKAVATAIRELMDDYPSLKKELEKDLAILREKCPAADAAK